MQLGTIKTIPFVRKHCHIFKRFVLNLNHHCFNRDISILIRYSSAQTKIVYYIRQIKMDDCFFFGKNYLWQLVFSDSPFFPYAWNCMSNIHRNQTHNGISQQMILVSKLHNGLFPKNLFQSQKHNDFAMVMTIYIDLINSYSVFFNLEAIVSLFPSM